MPKSGSGHGTPAPAHTGRVVLRLSAGVVALIAQRARNNLPDLLTLEDAVGVLSLGALATALAGYPGVVSRRAIRNSSTLENVSWEEAAAGSGFAPRHSLISYFILDPRKVLDPADLPQLLADLNAAKPDVDLAYREVNMIPAKSWAVDPTNEKLAPQQGYLNNKPQGIGVNNATVWGALDGSGVGFVDLENGWILAHQDLPVAALNPQPIENQNDKFDEDHGAAVLGIVVGQQNGMGIVGIAPKARFLGVVSQIVSIKEDRWDLIGAIRAAGTVLKKGDVLLLEVHTATGYPVEVEDQAFDAITVASGNGIIVIEAAGNGTASGTPRDLDKPLPLLDKDDASPPRSLNPDDKVKGTFADSGAILVSACKSATRPNGTHRRVSYASYGKRVDCYAWGDNVVTAGFGDLSETKKANRYTELFNGTSSAAAIIAGAAILIQQMAQQQGGPPLTPVQLRARLSDPRQGTPIEGFQPPRQIGLMPDLEAIVRGSPVT
jgi:hypothetical protein